MNVYRNPESAPNMRYDYPPAPPKRKWSWQRITACVVAGVLVGIGIAALFLNNSKTTTHMENGQVVANVTQTVKPAAQKPDSGVEACKEAADSITTKHLVGKYAPQKDADLAAAKQPFTSSQYTDLQNTGTAAVQAIYETNKAVNDPNGSFGDALAKYAVAQAKWGLLQDACKSHGVTLPPLPSNDNT